MGIGSAVRRRLGRFEIPASEAYRNRFIDLDSLATTLASLTGAKRILEIGSGDGSFGERLVKVFPDATYVGIDVAATPGRFYREDPARATFRSITSSDFLAEHPEPFDLVTIVDVVHHVPEELRIPILTDAAKLTAPGGMVAVKEWERGKGLAHVMAYTADRYVSGDKTVRFADRDELRQMIETGLPDFRVVCESRIPPRRNNVLYALRRATEM